MNRKPKIRANEKATRSGNNAKGLDQAPYLPGLERSIFDGSPLPIATLAGSNHIVSYANPAFFRMVGKLKEQVIGIPFAEVLPSDQCVSILDRVYRTGEAETVAGPEHSDSRPVYWSYVMWPVLGVDDRPVGVIFQVTDTARFHQQAIAMNQQLLQSTLRQHELTEKAEKLNAQLQLEIVERKRMEQALLISGKLAATARLAAAMAHEINNPLAAIMNLTFLLAPLQTTTEARTYIATLDQQVRGLSRIATQVLKFNRDHSRATEFRLAELLNEIADFYQKQADKQGVVVNRRIETEGLIAGFRGEITQVITNLLLNALDATPAGGQVSVHLYPAPPWLCEAHHQCGYCLTVADTGSGIDPEHRPRIFEPFFTTKGEKGSGLGLWLSIGIVNRIGGSIRLWSTRRPDCSGTCFSVFLPADEATFTPLRRRYERESRYSH